jgi:hypothetical protein
MRVQKCVSRRLGEKEYVKYQIVISNNIIQELGWNPSEHLEARVSPKGLLLYKVESKHLIKENSYEEFKKAVTKALGALPEGCIWAELRRKADLRQLTPSPIWVKRLEEEKCLERIRNPVTSQVIWRPARHTYTPIQDRKLNEWMTGNQKSHYDDT